MMNRHLLCKAGILATTMATLCLGSCVKVNEDLGGEYIATNLQYDIYTTSFDLDDIYMDQPDSLSGSSLYRFTIGAIRDKDFGLTTRAAAFTLVPIADTLDFGDAGTQKFSKFHFAAIADSISVESEDQSRIIQNINVYELTAPIDYTLNAPVISHGTKRITKGIPVYNGTDSLTFDFSKEFGEKYMTMLLSETDSIDHYTKRFPGIYISTDSPAGYGGRINMFKVPLDVEYNSSYGGVINGSIATLYFSAKYDGEQVDTSFIFYFGPVEKYDLAGVTSTTTSEYPQLAYNISTNETNGMKGKATDKIYVEGGKGLKPVIKAESLREKVIKAISENGDPSKAIISKASIEMPFEFPDDYNTMSLYPVILSPTCRIVTDTSITFAGLTDSSSSDENQGDINRSTLKYAPDISHHIQELLNLEDLSKISNYDIWLLAMANETVTTSSSSSSSSSDMAEYYQYLAYNSYYSSLYGGYGGYGSYGSYGSYGNSYSNYLSYMMLASMYSSSSDTEEETQTMLDLHRFYKAVLNGPTAERHPTFSLTYAIQRTE